MKKKISIMVVLVMMLSVFSGFAYAEVPSSVSTMFNSLKASSLGQKVLGLETAQKYNVGLAILALDEQNIVVNGLMDAIDLPGAAGLKQRLINNGVDRDTVNVIADKISTVRNNISILSFINNGGLSTNITLNTQLNNSGDTIGTELTRVYDELLGDPGNINAKNMHTKVNEKLNPGKTKANLVLDLANLLVNNMNLTKSVDTYTITINNNTIITGLNETIIPAYFKAEVTGITSEEINAILNHVKTKMQNRLNDDTFSIAIKDSMVAAVAAIKAQPQTPPPSGGFIPTLPPAPAVEGPEVVDGKVELGEGAVEVKTGTTGQTLVSVKEANVTAAIDALVEAVKEDAKLAPQLTIKLDDAKTLAMEVSVPSDSLAKLAQNKIDLVIESKTLTYVVPANTLEKALKDVPNGSYVEFVSSVVEEVDAKDLIKDDFAKKIAKTMEMQLVVKNSKGEVIKGINKFDNKIKISIEIEAKDGNPDLLGVFHINEETGKLEFVGGKIKGNKIFMSTNHYSKFAVVEYNKSFSDIQNHWSKDYVESMVAKHIVDGFTDVNLYKPEDKLTRAQFAKLLVETLEVEKTVSKGEFKDVNSNHWAKDYIATAKQLGIIGGYADGTFKPDVSITRAEMAVMLTNSLKLQKKAMSIVLNQFKDAQEVPAWAVEYMVPVVTEKLLVGSDGVLNPLGDVSRAEAATIIYRVYNR